MLFRQFINEDMGCASYLVADADTGRAAVVDPQWEVAPYLAMAAEHRLRIEHVVETHTHADHVSGHGVLVAATGATLHIHPLGQAEFPHQPLDDGAEIVLGDVVLRAVHLPGHRPEHTGLLVIDSSRGGDPWAVLTGDSLFVGDVARPDLAVDAADGAGALFESMGRLLGLPDWVEVYPGHIGGSLCGSAAINAKTSSTIGFERAHSPILAEARRGAFVAELMSRTGVKPPDLERIVALNRGPLRDAHDQVPPLTPHELRDRAAAGAVVVDGRESPAFAAAHVPGALSSPLPGSGFATKVAMMTAPTADLLLVAEDAEGAREMARRLASVGRRPAGFLAGGFGAWAAAGLAVEAIERITPAELVRRRAADPELVVVDVREDDEWEAGHLPGAVHAPYWSLGRGGGALPAGRPLAVVCSGGRRAAVAASALAARGLGPVLHVDGGGVDDAMP